jgi:hypothetical protein
MTPATRPVTPRVEYVIVAETGALERQALLLAESIRLLPGAAGDAPLTVVSPRPGRRPRAATIRRLDRLGAGYLALDLPSACPAYGPSYKLAAASAVERRAGPDVLVMIDSDTLFLSPPDFALPPRAVALRPVDVKGICPAGPGDPYEPYWRELSALCGVAYDDIPWLETSCDGERVKASHNGGLVVAQRGDGLFATSEEFMRRSVVAGLFPRSLDEASARGFRTGSGRVELLGRRLWGSMQAVLSLALVARGLEQRLLPPTYNVPCHHFDRVAARHPEVRSGTVHAHYHWLFEAGATAANPLLDGRIHVPAAVRELFARHGLVRGASRLARRMRALVAPRRFDGRRQPSI